MPLSRPFRHQKLYKAGFSEFYHNNHNLFDTVIYGSPEELKEILQSSPDIEIDPRDYVRNYLSKII